MSQLVPVIPDSAPFTPAQRAWLNGYIAGMFSQTPIAPQPASSAASRDVVVLFASQTGTSERLAKKAAKELKLRGHTARVHSLEDYDVASLAKESCALLLASTYGEGDPPDSAKRFFDALNAEGAPRMVALKFSVLALGDRHYEHFCKFGIDLADRLIALGAAPLCNLIESDIEVDEPFDAWRTEVLARLSGADKPAASKVTTLVETPASLYHRENPFDATLLDKRTLTHNVSSKQTLHLAFSLPPKNMDYEAGDALAVLPRNDHQLVEEILTTLHIDATQIVELPKHGACAIVEALSRHLQITRLSRKLVERYAKAGDCHTLLAILRPEQQTHFDQYIHDRGLIDLLIEYPDVIATAQQLVDLLSGLAPRLYSISSSPKAHKGEVHATVAVVRYRSHNRERGGVCSTMFADRLSLGNTQHVYIQANKKFRLPTDGATPIIMVGPGTGIAPFRGFLHERCATGAKGRNWLFFGERSAATDFLYQDELEQMQRGGLLSRLDTAFSRDQAHKIYVQDRMVENGAELYAWLQEGASLYVCGDATYMAKDVDAALHSVIERHGALDPESAREYVQSMHDDRRYLRDVY